MVYYDLLKPGETAKSDRYENQIVELKKCLIAKRPEWANRYEKVILLHDNAPAYTTKGVKSMSKDISWEVLIHLLYSSDFYLFRSMAHTLAEQHFKNLRRCSKLVSEMFAFKPQKFF